MKKMTLLEESDLAEKIMNIARPHEDKNLDGVLHLGGSPRLIDGSLFKNISEENDIVANIMKESFRDARKMRELSESMGVRLNNQRVLTESDEGYDSDIAKIKKLAQERASNPKSAARLIKAAISVYEGDPENTDPRDAISQAIEDLAADDDADPEDGPTSYDYDEAANPNQKSGAYATWKDKDGDVEVWPDTKLGGSMHYAVKTDKTGKKTKTKSFQVPLNVKIGDVVKNQKFESEDGDIEGQDYSKMDSEQLFELMRKGDEAAQQEIAKRRGMREPLPAIESFISKAEAILESVLSKSEELVESSSKYNRRTHLARGLACIIAPKLESVIAFAENKKDNEDKGDKEEIALDDELMSKVSSGLNDIQDGLKRMAERASEEDKKDVEDLISKIEGLIAFFSPEDKEDEEGEEGEEDSEEMPIETMFGEATISLDSGVMDRMKKAELMLGDLQKMAPANLKGEVQKVMKQFAIMKTKALG